MEKIAVGPKAAGKIDINKSVKENLEIVAKVLKKDITEVTATVLDRERHLELIKEIRASGARIKLITDGDVAAAINTAFPDTGVDILFGSGGAPEGVLAAVALKCLGGEIQGRLLPQDQTEIDRCLQMGIDPKRILKMEDLVKGDDAIFAATGVTDGELLKGVRFQGNKASTQSIVMRAKSGTVRIISGEHRLEKKPNLIVE